MTTVPVKDEYLEVLTALGDLEAGVDLALHRFVHEQVATRIAESRKTDSLYQARYDLDYPTFARRVGQDEAFVRQLEAQGHRMWEADLADWEFAYKGIGDWTRTLQRISLT